MFSAAFAADNLSCKPPLIMDKFSWWGITGAAAVDSINPCAIAVLLILLETLLLSGERKKSLLTGGIFILAIYLSYFILGIGLSSLISLAPYARTLHIAIGILAIVVGLANIKDYFWYGKVFVMEIPRAWRPRLGQIIHRTTNPYSVFLIGIAVTLFELPCTGGPYLFATGLMAKMSFATRIFYLVYYNFLFVLPLIIIMLAIYFGFSTIEKTSAWRERNLKLLHLIAGMIMLGLGMYLLT